MVESSPDMKLRVPAALRRKIEASADRNNRTLNSEIVSLLEQALGVSPDERHEKLSSRIALLENAVASIHLRIRKMESGPPRGFNAEDITDGFAPESPEGLVTLRTLGIDDND